ncbi:MAG: hypothetical protein HY805_02205 [Nitrospirae bacterium]|nr:hypothetical protein [Nitrospirota bacterium]
MEIYKTYFSPEFLKQTTRYSHFKKVIANKIKLLAENPYVICKSELLVGELKGLRSARITKSFRAIFSVCEECMAKRFQKLVGCSPSLCEKMGSDTIVFLTFGPHDKAYS